jgi:ribonuclease BN (tRNA processing enzyme)
MLYRLGYHGRTVVYATDIDLTRWAPPEFVRFARRADVLILDAQYASPEEPRELSPRACEWGHTAVRNAAEVAREADVGELVLFHHDPRRSDAEITDLERAARTIFPPTRAAREGMELHLR